MPVHRGADSIGVYYQWGDHGRRYYYQSNNPISRMLAKAKAIRQAQAIYSNGYRGK